MPDENKFAKLRVIGYTIPGTCGDCSHRNFPTRSPWGTCKLHRYDHARQDNPPGGRGVSIRVEGRCDNYEPDTVAIATKGLGAHSEFSP